MKKFTHLHLHSHYSLLDGLPKIKEILDYIEKLGMSSVALTDHGNLYGAVEFYKTATKKGIKPIIGCEMYLAYEKMHQRRANIDDKKYHLVLLVKNEKGYKNLVKLVTKAHLEGFYYKPRIDEDLLSQHSEGLIALSACLQGKIPQLILKKKIREAIEVAFKYQNIFGKDNFYLELQHHPNISDQKKVNKALIEISKKCHIPLVATNDCHYLSPEDAKIQDILMLINTGAKPDDPERLTMRADDFSIRSPERMIKDFEKIPEAIENTQKITELCNFKFKTGEIKLPIFETPNKETPQEYLTKLCYRGIKNRYGERIPQKVIQRMKYELEIIKKTGFASYFLIVQDLVNWAKENGIVVGPGRGSVGSSLVAYLLNITNIDPLKYDLLFERFLNPERISLPDIDLDFTDRRRDEVIEYAAKKYGRDKVAQIITFGTMAARAVVRDVGRALGYSYSYCDKIAKMIPANFTLDETLANVKEFQELYLNDEKAQRLIDYAKKIEGCARHVSTHACGVVISSQPLEEFIPLQHATQNKKIVVTQYEMHSIEELGLLKIDFLGLKNLTIIEDTLNLISQLRGKKIEIENILLDDKKTFKLLQRGETTGVFQLESEGMKRYLKQLKPNTIEDIIAMLALYRPGPMNFIPDYIAGKHKKKKIEYLHPKLKPILAETFSIPVYQEQIMKIAQELAGFSLVEADVLRKAIGKKIRALLLQQKEKFISGCKKNNIDEETALKIWHWFEPFARYSFNKSHSTAYAIIAYQTAFLKTHFPLEFMTSLLTSDLHDVERVGFLISECKRMGIEVLPPDINESLENFTTILPNKIRFGLLAIKNVGHNTVKAIVNERIAKGPYRSIFEFVQRINPKDLNKKSFEALIKAGCFDRLGERNQLLENLERLLELCRESQKMKMEGQKGLFDNLSQGVSFKLFPAKPATSIEKLKWEKELLGLYVTSHPVERFKKFLEKKVLPLSQISQDLAGRVVKIGGVISSIKKVLTKNGKPMLFTKIEDREAKIEVIVFPGTIERYSEIFQQDKVVIIKGRVDTRDGIPKVICEEALEIIET